AVFSGMIGVTFFGIFLTPVFYYGIMRMKGIPPDEPKAAAVSTPAPAAPPAPSTAHT
ncbi:MAG: hypothetical protein JNK76_12890, partial [Planctomycetales bacterium]|nr:hypothetical protein [Planctomycetales bacterium]